MCHTTICTSFGNLLTNKIFFIPDIYLTFFFIFLKRISNHTILGTRHF